MAMHNTNIFLKYVFIPVIVAAFIWLVLSLAHSPSESPKPIKTETAIKNSASNDSAAESLDTLTADLSSTKQKIAEVTKYNETLKQQNASLLNQINAKHSSDTVQLANEVEQLKNDLKQEVQNRSDYKVNSAESGQALTTISDLSSTLTIKNKAMNLLATNSSESLADFSNVKQADDKEHREIPYYTIPANATSVRNKLMTALIGRIPVKGVVVDPYPFKIVVSDDNLAANGLRIPHLSQMIVSGYCEGDLGLVGVRGWVTSLTFVFDDGTISTTTSNNNDIGNFTKSNSLGYLSDKFGNPLIPGVKFITNAPVYLGGNALIGGAVGAANAYAQSQTTTNSSPIGGISTTSVTGSQGKFVAGQALSNSASEVQQWWHDREEQSFDAVYVPPTDAKGNFIEVEINFSKEIHIDYDPKGRKLNYAHNSDAFVKRDLD